MEQDERTPLHWAASSGSIDIVRFLVDQKTEIDKVDGSGWTALHIAGTCLMPCSFLLTDDALVSSSSERGIREHRTRTNRSWRRRK